MHRSGSFDILILVPHTPIQPGPAFNPNVIYWMDAPLLVEAGFMSGAADTEDKLPSFHYLHPTKGQALKYVAPQQHQSASVQLARLAHSRSAAPKDKLAWLQACLQ